MGAGNVPVIIDSTADLGQAAAGIVASKTFDNATSCSSENSLVILDDIYERALDELRKAGAYVVNGREKRAIRDALWVDGKLNREVIARDADVLARRAGLGGRAATARLFLVEDELPARTASFADEKLSLVLTVYRAAGIREAIETVRAVLEVRGRGHSCGTRSVSTGRVEGVLPGRYTVGVATASIENARLLATELDVVRVLVNQAHAIGNGGSFVNGLPFTLTMGCGTWAGNSISENLNYRHFINLTHLSTTIPEDRPTEEALFGDHWRRHGD